MISNKKLNILFPFVGTNVGGSHISAVFMAKELLKRQHKVNIVGQRELVKKCFFKSFSLQELSTFYKPSTNKVLILFLILINSVKILIFLKKKKYDLIHINDHRTGYYWILPAVLFGIPLVYHYRTKWIESRLMRFLLRKTNKIICISRYVKCTLPMEFQKKSHIHLNNFENPLKINKWKKNKSKSVIMYFGTINKQKNIITFCKMANQLIKIRKDFIFKIVGTKSEYFSEIMDYINKNKQKKYFRFFEFSDSMSEHLYKSDLVIAPAINDGFGRTLVESMLHRVPIIASKSGGHVEIIKSGYNGVLVDLFDHHAYAKEVIKILSDSSFRKAITKKAYIFAKNNFIKKANSKIDLLIKCYQKIL